MFLTGIKNLERYKFLTAPETKHLKYLGLGTEVKIYQVVLKRKLLLKVVKVANTFTVLSRYFCLSSINLTIIIYY